MNDPARKPDGNKPTPAVQKKAQATLDLDKASQTKPAATKRAPAANANGGERLDELARDIAERRPRGNVNQRKEPPVTRANPAEMKKTAVTRRRFLA